MQVLYILIGELVPEIYAAKLFIYNIYGSAPQAK